MGLNETKELSGKLWEFYIGLWHSFFMSKSADWIYKNVPHISYDKPIYDHIIATAACMHITEDLSVHEVSGNWLIVSFKDNQ